MIRHLKTAKAMSERADADRQVRATVEGILADIEARGDTVVAGTVGKIRRLVAGQFPAERY